MKTLDPLKQFTIENWVPAYWQGYNISFTNSSFWALMSVFLCVVFLYFATRKQEIIPGRLQSYAELLYEFIEDLVESTVGKKGRKFIAYVFSVFMFVLSCNLAGLLPYGFTVTSHIVVTFALSVMILTFVTIVGFCYHGFAFLRIFAPKHVSAPVLLLLTPIEIISYCMRTVSLSIRLFANMMAGHVVLKLFAWFVLSVGLIFGIFPFVALTFLMGLEFIISVIQAYVFSVMTCIYVKDALYIEH